MSEEYRNVYPSDEEYWYTPKELEFEHFPINDECSRCPKEIEVKCPKNMTVSLREKVLCASLSATNSAFSSSGVEVVIPPNAAITKIYASILQSAANPIDNGYIRIYTGSINLFAQEFFKLPLNIVGGYETTLVQPLYVGPTGARAGLFSYRGITSTPSEILRIVVVYCPDYDEILHVQAQSATGSAPAAPVDAVASNATAESPV